ncbi:helix-turn-helix domain-containing protein [Nocardia rhizosphaerae]|uniref:Helix-turn-helix domain-containing protein n=1 Tax=Nocardia rhizosphaerae TaxID=1691571 RepID=A0ABV8LAE2_9NOCA
MSERTGETARQSPPTDRVVAVVEYLAALGKPTAAADLADGLGLSRSTVGAILSSLCSHRWVSRLPDLRYTIGPAVFATAARARAASDRPADLVALLDGLAARVGCGAALSLVDAGQLVFVAVTRGLGRIPAGVEVGLRLPLQAPAGAAVVAFADPAVQRQWLDTAPAGRRDELGQGLAQIAERGVAVWGARVADLPRIDVLGRVIAHLSADTANQPLRDEVHALMVQTSGHLHPAPALDADAPLPISYLSAPVFDRQARPLWELQIGPLRPSVPLAERTHYIAELVSTAKELGDYVSGD